MTNISFIAWAFIMLGVWGIFKGFSIVGVTAFDVVLNLFFLNVFLWLLSYFINYRDGTKIFQLGYILTAILVLIELTTQISWMDLMHIVMILIVFTFGIYSFINFGIKLFRNTYNENLGYIVFLLFNLSMLIFIYSIARDSLYEAVLYCQFYITFLYFFIYFTKKYDEYIEAQPEEKGLTLDDVLKRKKKEPIKKPHTRNFLLGLNSFFHNMPMRAKFLISISNIFLIFGQIYLFVSHIYQVGSSNQIAYYELLYWIGIILFFTNFFLLKFIDYYYYLQRIVAFFIINFGIYLSIINLFGGNILYIVIIGVFWNIFNNIVIFSTQKLKDDKILMKEDYYLWILSNGLALLLNIYFIFRLIPNIMMAVSVVVLYLGIQLFLSFYNVRFIEKE